jgi:ssRNA-specific RNase YbeY (16S rRNA maturation enzyme)
MPLALAGLTVVIAILALGFAIGLRTQVARISRTMASDLEQLSRTLVDLRGQIDQLHREVADLKAATDVVSMPPPLPKPRPGRLDDLREQLRASHRESESSPEE